MPTVALPPTGKFQVFDVNGDPGSGFLVYTYQTGTSTPKATYTDATGNSANTNPVVCDARGEANIWILTDGNYRFKVHTAADALIYTIDGIGWASPTFEDVTVTDDLTVGGTITSTDGYSGPWPQWTCIVITGELETVTTGTAKRTVRFPLGTVLAVRSSLTTASSSGLVTVDINEAGTSILSTKLSIDANELTSTTAATPAVISDTAIASDAQMTIDVDAAGTGAQGLKVYVQMRWS